MLDKVEIPTQQETDIQKLFYFTFGVDHKLVSFCPGYAFEEEQVGVPVGDRYVLIQAPDEEAAREKMIKYFAHAWCGCYTLEEWKRTDMNKTYRLLTSFLS